MNIIQKILVPLQGSPNGSSAIEAGLHFAQTFGAHLSILHVRPDSRDIAPLAGEGISGAMVEEMISSAEAENSERLQKARTTFDTCMAKHNITLTSPSPRERKPGTVSASFSALTGNENEVIAFQARVSDVIVVPHPNAGDEISSSEALHSVLFDSGKPVIIAPSTLPPALGSRVCIGWNGSPESASALQSFLPWAYKAEAVQILYSEEYQRRGPHATEVKDYLAFHGIEASVQEFGVIRNNVGASLLSACDAFKADMLCIGAYSHSRLRQLILGGVTRHVLEHAKLALFMGR
ncbi:universal stress protein [Entomobacter blattae]|uniref:Universal stress protein family protein n=1 Tax=Entomobacter blattae TaxID=2762277 RepID=A0A7H1NQI5_9PROT|nr:universal stress protein [Entomobacter blattae]QNT78045.1 Universal stress protein family protein [Entomobacter blattae]